MVDFPPQKNDEQYPLLKVESGGGDIGRPPAQPAAAQGWNVSCSSKRPWYERWPELVSACWMTGMLLSIFVLIIYGLGTLGVIRKHPFFVLNCTSSGLDNQVFYHHIVQRGERIQFNRFSEYLSNMASQYSSLHLSVVFLIDDSMQFGYKGQRHSRFINKLLPYHSMREPSGLFDAFNQHELIDFQLKYQNVNITIMPLTKFMAMTPLKYKWRTIPLSYLTFYARVFSVWKYGGIGIDLSTFSDQYNKRIMPDRRITAVIKHYNKRTKPEDYANTLNNIDRDEQNEFFGIFYGVVQQILNETQTFFKRPDVSIQELTSKPVIRTHRNKRDVLVMPQNNTSDMNATIAIPKPVMNISDITIVEAPYQNTFIEATINNVTSNENVSLSMTDEEKAPLVEELKVKSELGTPKLGNKSGNAFETPLKNGSDVQHVVLLYDFSLFSDSMGPPYAFPALIADTPPVNAEDDSIDAVKAKKAKYFLSLTMEGSFVAALSKQHPFLGHIISSGCQRMPPRLAIQDAILSQCSSILHDDVYCSNIYVF